METLVTQTPDHLNKSN